MELSRKSCRICLSETEFNVSLFGNHCRRTEMVDKVLVCLKIVIEEADTLNTICYKCAENVERYHDFIMFVRKCQTKLATPKHVEVGRRVTSYVREQAFDADYTFSFLEAECKDTKPSSPFFSYFSPPKELKEVWKTPADKKIRQKMPRHHSRDLFDSQSQDVEEEKSFAWKLTPDNNILKRVRDKCFGRSEF